MQKMAGPIIPLSNLAHSLRLFSSVSAFILVPMICHGLVLFEKRVLWTKSKTIFLSSRQIRHDDKQTTDKPCEPRASLLFTSEEAVFCNGWCVVARMTAMMTMLGMMVILTFSENIACR